MILFSVMGSVLINLLAERQSAALRIVTGLPQSSLERPQRQLPQAEQPTLSMALAGRLVVSLEA